MEYSGVNQMNLTEDEVRILLLILSIDLGVLGLNSKNQALVGEVIKKLRAYQEGRNHDT
jgi:hypothetical protein